MRNIPFFDYEYVYNRHREEFQNIFDTVCSSGAFILQQELRSFESNLSNFMSVKHCSGVADGTNAMVLGLQASGIGPGDEVIISSHTYIATAAAIKLVGAVPIFCDIGDDWMMSTQEMDKLISSKTKAIMPTQLNGRCCDMDKISSVATAHNRWFLRMRLRD